jgi:sodium-dependent dicarboxylate transporter 2/3/5
MQRLTPWRLLGLIGGLSLFAFLAFGNTSLASPTGSDARPALAAGVTALMAVWWLTETFPIHWTACVPLIAFPLFRVLPGDRLQNLRAAAEPYVNPYIFLFLGGMCIAASMQQWGLHRRIALQVMRAVGTEPRRLLAGVLIATAAISMWISNTATATMMVPIGMAVISQLETRMGGAKLKRFGASLMLAIAYGANVGGMGTKIGTAPNAQLSGFLSQRGVEISFGEFAVIGTGFAFLFLPLIWLVLWRTGRADAPRADVGSAVLEDELAKLGPVRRAEWVVLGVFLATACLWILGKPMTKLLSPIVLDTTGFALRSAHVEGGTALLAAFVLGLCRVEGRAVLELRSLRLIPWSTLVLLGGGFAMAAGVQGSGLSSWMASEFAVLAELPSFLQVFGSSAATVGMSAVASNTATIAVMLSVLADAVTSENTMTVLFAATLASSCDFCLPAGTPPNAIVFGSGYLTVPRMAATGIALDLAAAVMVALWCSFIVDFVF